MAKTKAKNKPNPILCKYSMANFEAMREIRERGEVAFTTPHSMQQFIDQKLMQHEVIDERHPMEVRAGLTERGEQIFKLLNEIYKARYLQ